MDRAPRRPLARSIAHRALLRTLLTLMLLALLAVPTRAQQPAPSSLPCAEIVRDPLTGVPRTLRGCPATARPGADANTAARAFLRLYHDQLWLASDLSDLSWMTTTHGLGSSHVLYRQVVSGLPVYEAYLSLHLDQQGNIEVLHNGYQVDLQVDAGAVTVTAEQAMAIARLAIGFQQGRGNSPAPQQVVLPQDNHPGRLAWQVMILAAEPQGDWEVLVDAVSGQVIKRYNRLVRAKGQVFDPSPAQQAGRSLPSGPPWPELEIVNLPGLDGSGWLRGQYVDVTFPTGYRPASAFAPDGNFTYAPDDPRFEEVMVYYHVDATQRYIQSLGYSDANDPPNGIRDRVTFASPHWFAQDQSFYSISDDALHFGDGGVEDAEDADIIVHEYAHALQHDQLACWGGGEMDALGEGFGDYLAATRFAAIGDDGACIGEWDSVSYAPGPPYCLRRVDRERHYPEDVTGDPHVDGEIWSRALWDLRALVGAEVADTLTMESHFYLPCGATMLDAAQALLDADDHLYGSAHRGSLAAVLAARGLWEVPTPTLVVPNGGQVLKPGQQVPLFWRSDGRLPLEFELAYSVAGEAMQARSDAFDGSRLPADYLSFGTLPWHVAGEAAQAGAVDHGESSSLSLSVELAREGELGFSYRVSSEAGWDLFQFFLDGQLAVQASGDSGWIGYQAQLDPGSHQLLWRYQKDGTISQGEDSAWIDDVRLENLSVARWQPLETLAGNPAGGNATWQVPDVQSSAVKVRVRARLGDVTSAWDSSNGPFLVGDPTAVRLSAFSAGRDLDLAKPLPLFPWGVVGLGIAAWLGILLETWLWQRPRSR